MDPIDEKYIETMQQKSKVSRLMYKLYTMEPEQRAAVLKDYGLSEADFQAAGAQQAKEVETPPASLTKEKEPAPTGVGVETPLEGNPLMQAATVVFGVAPMLYSIIFGKMAGLTAEESGAGPVIQDIAEFIGNLINPAGEEKILAEHGPQVLSEVQQLRHSEANVTLLKKLMEGLKSGEIKPEQLTIKFANKLKGIPKSPKDAELRALKAGFVSAETEAQLAKASSRRINRLNHMLDVLKGASPEEQKLLLPVIADEFVKYQQLAVNRISTIDKEGRTIFRLPKHEFEPEQLDEIRQHAMSSEFPSVLDRILNPFRNEEGKIPKEVIEPEIVPGKVSEELMKNKPLYTKLHKAQLEWKHLTELLQKIPTEQVQSERGQKILKRIRELESILANESGQSQLISDVSSKLYGFGKFLLNSHNLYEAEVNAQMMNPAITIRKVATDITFIPFQRTMQSAAMAWRHKSLSLGAKQLIAAMSAYRKSFPEALKIMQMTFSQDVPVFERELVQGLTKTEARKLGFPGHATYGLEDAFDFTDPGMSANRLGAAYSVWSAGSRSVMSVDQFAKVLARRSGMRMMAMEHALNELEEAGELSGPRLVAAAEEMADQAMEEMPDWLIRSSNEDMYRTTFTNTGKLVARITSITRDYPWTRIFFPYIRTPMNLYKEGLKFSPLGFGMALLDEPNSLERTTTLSKAALGSLFAWWVMNETWKGNITGSGPANPAHYNMKLKPPYTMFGYGYQHLKPFGTVIALAADAAEAYSNIKDPADKEQMLDLVVQAAAKTLSNAPTMTGLTNLVDSYENAGKGNLKKLENYLGSTAAGFVPAPIRMYTQVEDPVYREAQGFINKIKKNLPQYSDTLPPYRKWDATPQYIPPGVDADGTPPDKASVFWNMISPLPEEHTDMDELDKELESHKVEFNRFPDHIKVGHEVVPISPDVRDKGSQLSGELKLGGMTQRERGLDLLTKPYYQNATDEEKRILLKGNHQLYMHNAKGLIMREIQGTVQGTTPLVMPEEK